MVYDLCFIVFFFFWFLVYGLQFMVSGFKFRFKGYDLGCRIQGLGLWE